MIKLPFKDGRVISCREWGDYIKLLDDCLRGHSAACRILEAIEGEVIKGGE